MCIETGSARTQQVTAIVSGRWTEMDQWDMAERVLTEAAGREVDMRRGRARGRWKRAFVFARAELSKKRKNEVGLCTGGMQSLIPPSDPALET
jgi:hypothetical protein